MYLNEPRKNLNESGTEDNMSRLLSVLDDLDNLCEKLDMLSNLLQRKDIRQILRGKSTTNNTGNPLELIR